MFNDGKPARSEKFTDEDGHLVVMGALGETFYLLSNQVIVGIDDDNNSDKDNLPTTIAKTFALLSNKSESGPGQGVGVPQ